MEWTWWGLPPSAPVSLSQSLASSIASPFLLSSSSLLSLHLPLPFHAAAAAEQSSQCAERCCAERVYAAVLRSSYVLTRVLPIVIFGVSSCAIVRLCQVSVFSLWITPSLRRRHFGLPSKCCHAENRWMKEPRLRHIYNEGKRSLHWLS